MSSLIPLIRVYDPDLEWVEREIARFEQGPLTEAEREPQMVAQRREHLERLRRVRARLLGEEPS